MTTNFVRGQKSKLSDLTPSEELVVGVAVEAPGSPVFDVSCFGVDENGKLSDDRYFVFYNQKQSPEGEIEALGARDGDREAFGVRLPRLPQKIQKLVFTVTLDGGGTMSQVSHGHLRLLSDGSEVAKFSFSGGDFSQEKAIIVGELYRKDVWRFAAVGQGFNGGLSALLQHFGGQEIEDSPAPTATPTPTPATAPPPPAAPEPAPAPKVSISKITLDKKGDKQTVDLAKVGGDRPIHMNLNWDTGGRGGGFLGFGGGNAPDLDLGCMYRLRNGEASVIQALGGNFGSKSLSPHIFLDKDDRSGTASDGENLYLYRPGEVDLVMVFAFIYGGASDFTSVGGRMTITDGSGDQVFIKLDSPDRGRNFCAICTVRGRGNSVEITKEEQYFRGHRDADQRYGFGFRWTRGSK